MNEGLGVASAAARVRLAQSLASRSRTSAQHLERVWAAAQADSAGEQADEEEVVWAPAAVGALAQGEEVVCELPYLFLWNNESLGRQFPENLRLAPCL